MFFYFSLKTKSSILLNPLCAPSHSCCRSEYKPGCTEVFMLTAPLFTWSVWSDSCYNVPELFLTPCQIITPLLEIAIWLPNPNPTPNLNPSPTPNPNLPILGENWAEHRLCSDHALAQERPCQIFTRTISKNSRKCARALLPPPCFTDGLRFLRWNSVCSFPRIL